jgi:hypothetical protein
MPTTGNVIETAPPELNDAIELFNFEANAGLSPILANACNDAPGSFSLFIKVLAAPVKLPVLIEEVTCDIAPVIFPAPGIRFTAPLALSIIFDTYNKVRNESSLEIANDAIMDEYNAHGFLLNCMSDLIGALIELSGDQGESIINEVKLILI